MGTELKPLPGDVRELILFTVQDILKRLQWVEETLCESEEEEKE